MQWSPLILHPFWPYLVPLPLSLSLLTFKMSELVTFLLLSFNTTAKETNKIPRVYLGSQFQRAESIMLGNHGSRQGSSSR